MTKNILIVTHLPDWDQCRLSLLPSIDRFVPGSCVVVIDNSLNYQKISCNDIPKFSNITCELLSAAELLENYCFVWSNKDTKIGYGWFRQQLCKLSGWKIFEHDYVALDSEIKILRPLTQWPRKSRLGGNKFLAFTERCREIFKIENNEHIVALPQVPWVFKPEILKDIFSEFTSSKAFYDWFVSNPYPSEFILYDLFEHKDHANTQLTLRPMESSRIQYIFDYPYSLDPDHYDFALIDRDSWKTANRARLTV